MDRYDLRKFVFANSHLNLFQLKKKLFIIHKFKCNDLRLLELKLEWMEHKLKDIELRFTGNLNKGKDAKKNK